jgi:hypothetical protein
MTDAIRKAVEAIALQPKSNEIKSELDLEYADFRRAYDHCIDKARDALAYMDGTGGALTGLGAAFIAGVGFGAFVVLAAMRLMG